MTYKTNDCVVWKGDDGILNHGQEYYVDLVRDGERVQEFTLKYIRSGHKVKDFDSGVIWWEVGSPFIKHQKQGDEK
jgi:hypothetical protein